VSATVHTIAARAGVDVPRLEAAYREVLLAIGEDPDREGLRDTPRRAAAAWQEFLDKTQAERLSATFTHQSAGNSYVLVHGIDCWSLCEHHLLPFRLTLAVAYLPTGGQVLGLSKLARIVAHHAHRLQLQERLCDEVADDLARYSGSPDIAVWAEGEHLCMSMRGVRATGARTVTEVLRGQLSTDTAITARLMTAAGVGRRSTL
jgi:GTP cyclohydrolase I